MNIKSLGSQHAFKIAFVCLVLTSVLTLFLTPLFFKLDPKTSAEYVSLAFDKLLNQIESNRIEISEFFSGDSNDDSYNSSSFHKYVILSVSIIPDREFYYFQLPMIVKSWERIGFRTIILIVSSKFPIENRMALKTIEYLKTFNAILVDLPTQPNYEVIVSLVSRLYGGLLDNSIIQDEDYLITSDTDLYPIDRKYYLYDRDLNKTNTCFLFNAFCCGDFTFRNKNYTMFPIGHIGMKKKYWKQVMNLQNYANTNLNSQIVLNELRNFFFNVTQVNMNSGINRGDNNWDMDQKMISVNIFEHHLRTNKAFELVKKPHNCRRLDRSDFNPLGYNMKLFCDMHSFHADVFNKLDLLENVFDKLFDKETNLKIKTYHQEFLKIKYYLN